MRNSTTVQHTGARQRGATGQDRGCHQWTSDLDHLGKGRDETFAANYTDTGDASTACHKYDDKICSGARRVRPRLAKSSRAARRRKVTTIRLLQTSEELPEIEDLFNTLLTEGREHVTWI